MARKRWRIWTRRFATTRLPASYFHRALTRWRLGQQTAAIEDLREARKMGLKPEDLSGLERGDYQSLAQSLKLPP